MRENIKLFEQNLIYTLLTGQSLFSESKIDYIFKETLELSKERDERLSFFEFFANQFLRTSRGRKAVLDATESTKNKFSEEILYQKTTKYLFPLMMCCMTFTFSYCLWKKDFYLEMLLNKTSANFITNKFLTWFCTILYHQKLHFYANMVTVRMKRDV